MSIDIVHLLTYFIGYLLAIWVGSLIVAKVIKTYAIGEIPKGYKNAGKIIGQLERFLIFTALILNSYALVGIVLTLKAIYRFGDISGDNETKMKISEYFIIGTLSSLSWTIIIFALCRFVVNYF